MLSLNASDSNPDGNPSRSSFSYRPANGVTPTSTGKVNQTPVFA
jgi:hypothetical protein